MYETILLDVKEVVHRLQVAGNTNIDFNAIFHLLEEFGPGCDMDFIRDLLLASNESKQTANARNTKKEEHVKQVSPGPSKTEESNETIVIDLTLNSQTASNLQEDSIDINEDSDLDDSNYYENDEVFDMEEQRKSPPPLIPPICFFENTEEPLVGVQERMENNNGNTMGENNVEIFEENNNDPNNNMDSIENSVPNQNNNSKHFERATIRECTNGIIDRGPRSSSPKPGCSKDISSDDYSSSDETMEFRGPYWLVQITKKILTLMPYLKFETVYKTLKNNREFDDCIEVTLWEILSKNMSKAIPKKNSKRKSLELPKDFDKKRMRPAESNSKSFNEKMSTKDLLDEQNQRQEDVGVAIREMPLVAQFPHKQMQRVSKRSALENNLMFKRSKGTAGAERLVTGVKVKMEHHTNSTSMQASKIQAMSSDGDSDLEEGKESCTRARLNNSKKCDHSNDAGSSKTVSYNNILQAPKLIIGNNHFKAAETLQMNNNGSIKKVILVPSKLQHLPAHKSSNEETKTATVTSNSFENNTIVKVEQEVAAKEKVSSEPDMKPNEDVKSIPEFLNLMASKLKDDDYTQNNEKNNENKNNENKKNEKSHFQEHYYMLRGIFPNVDRQFIMSTCRNIKGSSPENTLLLSIEHLLIYGNAHPNTEEQKKVLVEEPTLDFEELYKNLLDIFPNADPNYLKDFVRDNYNNPDAIKEFVQSKLENHDYPTLEEYRKNQRLTEQQRQYTSDFNIEKFLEIIPDPVAYFEDPNRKQAYSPIVFEFLKSRYHRIKIVTISWYYRKTNYHFTLTAKRLDETESDMRNKRNSYQVRTFDIPILQEMAYVEHRNEIKAHLEQKRLKEEQEFQELKAQDMLLECQCCFNDECVPSKCSECENGHIFCHSCIEKGIKLKMSDGDSHVKCFTDCGSEFSLSVLQKVLSPTQFSILLKKRQEAEVMAAGLDGLVSCPFCPFASIPPPEDKVFKCLNPDCMKESCCLCKELNHVPLKCEEVTKADKARRLLEEKMTQALLRTCYRCKKQFFKEDGCNKMTCVCGAMMCYICDSPVKDYSHFSGQGSERSNLCPLWSDNRRMNAQTVRKVADEVMKDIEAKNPELRIDTAKLLPVIPPKTRGPHDDIPFADALPPYIHRILRPQ